MNAPKFLAQTHMSVIRPHRIICAVSVTSNLMMEVSRKMVERHTVTCGFLDTEIGNDPHFEYHKYKCRKPMLKPPAYDDNSHRSITEREKVLPCGQYDQVFNSWNTLMDHTNLQHDYECFEIPGTNSHVSNHITYKFQCDACFIHFIKDNGLKKHISEDHRAKWRVTIQC